MRAATIYDPTKHKSVQINHWIFMVSSSKHDSLSIVHVYHFNYYASKLKY